MQDKLLAKVKEWQAMDEDQIRDRIETIQTRITMVKMHLIESKPFWGDILMRMRPTLDFSVPTTAVDKNVRLHYNPIWVDCLSDKDLVFELMHETMHVVQDLFETRIKGTKWERPEFFPILNMASDWIIDTLLSEGGNVQSLPSQESVGPEQKELAKKYGTAEALAEFLLNEHKKKCSSCQKQGKKNSNKGKAGTSSGKSGNDNESGSGSSGDSNHNGSSGDSSSGSGQNQNLKDQIQQAAEKISNSVVCPNNIRQCSVDPRATSGDNADKIEEWILNAASKAKSKGELPGKVQEFLIKLETPKIPWQQILRKAVSKRFRKEYTFQRKNRRGLNVRIPAKRKNPNRCAVVTYDASGSISPKEDIKFLSEIYGILTSAGVEKAYIVFHDVKVYHVEEFTKQSFEKVKNLPLTKGGTSHKEVFEVLDGTHPNKDFHIKEKCKMVICFTDLFTTFPDRRPDADVVWVGVKGNFNTITPPFGMKIEIEDD